MNAVHCSNSCYQSGFTIFIRYCLVGVFFFFLLLLFVLGWCFFFLCEGVYVSLVSYNVRKLLCFWPQSELLLCCVCGAGAWLWHHHV